MKNKIAPYLAWFAATSFVFFQFFLQSASTIMSDYWADDFQLNKLELSNLSAAFFYSYIPMQFPAGVLYDKYNAKIILLLSAITLSIFSFMFAYVHNYELAVIARFFMGLGAASGFVGLLRIIQNHFSVKLFALMFGIAEAIGMMGVSIALVWLAIFLNSYSWRAAMYVCGTISALLAVSIFLFVKKSEPKAVPIPFSLKTLTLQVKSILMNKQVIYPCIYGFFIISIFSCFTSLWGQPFLDSAYDFDSKTVSSLLSMVFIGIAIGSPLNGWLVKKYGKYRELLLWEAGFSILATSILIWIPGLSLPALYFLFLAIGFLCSGYGPCYALVNVAVAPEIQATAVAIANMLIIASAPILQVLIGWILDANSFGFASSPFHNFQIALTVLPLSYFISFLAAFFIKTKSEKVEVQYE